MASPSESDTMDTVKTPVSKMFRAVSLRASRPARATEMATAGGRLATPMK